MATARKQRPSVDEQLEALLQEQRAREATWDKNKTPEELAARERHVQQMNEDLERRRQEQADFGISVASINALTDAINRFLDRDTDTWERQEALMVKIMAKLDEPPGETISLIEMPGGGTMTMRSKEVR
ncbi:MAG TPA: hypothetical protein VMT29_22100 [Steroidobacteraceae bacterium]|nr:hypothetical protein [Steroidobacteraceae bacterium]